MGNLKYDNPLVYSDFWIEYEHMLHFNRPESMKIYFRNKKATDTVSLWMDRLYYQEVQIKQIDPQPIATLLYADKVVFKFVVPEKKAPAMVSFQQNPGIAWKHQGTVGQVDGPSLFIWQFIYP